MLSRRQKDILQQLERADDFISIRTLCETCSLSEKTMLSELTVIETILQEQEIEVAECLCSCKRINAGNTKCCCIPGRTRRRHSL